MDPAAGPEPQRPRWGRPRKALFALVPLLLLAGGAEAVCRLKEGGQAPLRDACVDDAYCGYRFQPGARHEERHPGGALVATFNDLGHRGRGLARRKPPGVYRVACLGGSTTYGLRAPDDAAAYPALLEGQLAARRPVEVLNAGVPGWTLRDSLTNYQRHLAPHAFDLVVVMNVQNDLLEHADPDYQQDSLAEDPEALARPPSALHALLRRSAAYRRLLTALQRRRLERERRATLDEAGVAAYERNLRRCVRVVRQGGAAALLCTQPHLYWPNDEEGQRALGERRFRGQAKWLPLEQTTAFQGMERLNALVRRVAAEEGAHLADLAASFPRDPALYVDFIHHTPEGTRLKARLVADAILAGPLAPEPAATSER